MNQVWNRTATAVKGTVVGEFEMNYVKSPVVGEFEMN